MSGVYVIVLYHCNAESMHVQGVQKRSKTDTMTLIDHSLIVWTSVHVCLSTSSFI